MRTGDDARFVTSLVPLVPFYGSRSKAAAKFSQHNITNKSEEDHQNQPEDTSRYSLSCIQPAKSALLAIMANPPAYPADPNPNIRSPPPSVSSNSSVALTLQSASVADDSGSEHIPTPTLFPRGGSQYDDLPPSYDEAQHQAVDDARKGLTPLDPNQLEAYRLTLNEGWDEPEVWEYRVRGEEQEENKRALEYDNHINPLGATVPIQHNSGRESIPVSRVKRENVPAYTAPDPTAALLERALSLTRLALDSDTQYTLRLKRPAAIP
jgi:hypothetical protein